MDPGGDDACWHLVALDGCPAGVGLRFAGADTSPFHAAHGGREPGQWGPSDEKGASARAQAYQEQISGHSYDEVYWVGGVGRKNGGVKFDGFKDGVMLEAKGPGYAEFFENNLEPKRWFRNSGKAQELVDQALRQRKMIEGMDLRMQWHIAEKHAADAIRKLFERSGVKGVEVIHTPAR